jgi:hypothetical protein
VGDLHHLRAAIEASDPPKTMPRYYRGWRIWWAMALGIMRRLHMRRPERDEWHRRLVAAYSTAAARQGGDE